MSGSTPMIWQDRELRALHHVAKSLQKEREDAIASVIGRQAEALVNLIDQRVEDALLFERVVRPRLIDKALHHLPEFIKRRWPALFQKDQHRELQIAQRRDLTLDLAAAIFQQPHAILDGHFQGQFSNHSDDHDANPAAPGVHRLSDEAPHT